MRGAEKLGHARSSQGAECVAEDDLCAFRTKEQILQAASQMMISRMALPSRAMQWDRRLRIIVAECRRLRSIYPVLSRIELILSLQDMTNPHVRVVTNAIVECFTEAGLQDAKARELTRMFFALWLGEMAFDDAAGMQGATDGLETALDFIAAGIKADIAINGRGERGD